jgi:hypothetical protein
MRSFTLGGARGATFLRQWHVRVCRCRARRLLSFGTGRLLTSRAFYRCKRVVSTWRNVFASDRRRCQKTHNSGLWKIGNASSAAAMSAALVVCGDRSAPASSDDLGVSQARENRRRPYLYPPLPHVVVWYERLQQRPAYREHVMIPFEELRGRLDY